MPQTTAITAKNSIGDWFRHPVGGDLVRGLITSFGATEQMLDPIRSMPLAMLVGMSGGLLTEDTVRGVVLEANGGVMPEEDDTADTEKVPVGPGTGVTDVAGIVARMTLEEKLAQLTGIMAPMMMSQSGQGTSLNLSGLSTIRPHGVGHLSLAWFLLVGEDEFRASMTELQAASREISRFGIGTLVHAEGINGLVHSTGIQYPTAWAQAATWMPDLVERSSAITGAHFRDLGLQLCFSPVLDIVRDPRWGRVHETYGEDVELVSQIGSAFIRGVNGRDLDSGVKATGKHFLGYGMSEGGLNQARTAVGPRQLADELAEPFRRAIAEAGLSVAMNSYNEVDGIPATASREIMTGLLRENLGFDGLVVSDYDSIKMILRPYHMARDAAEATAFALNAGTDVELPNDEVFAKLPEALERGLLSMDTVDTAVSRVLELKRDVGLIQGLEPLRPHRAATAPDRAAAGQLAREIAVNGATLLQNDGVLPLSQGSRVLVVGSLADELRIHFGAYTDVANEEQPFAMNMIRNGEVPGIDPETFNFTDSFQARIPGIATTFEGVARTQYPDALTLIGELRRVEGIEMSFLDVGSADHEDPIDSATLQRAAKDADVVLAVFGERTGWMGNNAAGEGQSTALNELRGGQKALAAALVTLGTPVVTVLIAGRPLIVTDLSAASSAVLLAPLLGAEGPRAVADILVGNVEPGGRLPSTFPRHVGQIPLYHGHAFGSGYAHPTGSRHPYNDLEASPLYPFGHGLGYTEFTLALDDVSVNEADGTITTRATITNSGGRSGSTVVQVYARDEEGSTVRPVRRLAVFERVRLETGASRSIELSFPITRLAYTFADGRRGVEQGEVTILLALSSADVRGEQTVTVDERTVNSSAEEPAPNETIEVEVIELAEATLAEHVEHVEHVDADEAVTANAEVVVGDKVRAKPLTANSSIGTWLKHPTGGPIVRQLMVDAGMNEKVLVPMKLFPLQQLVSMSGGQLKQEVIKDMVTRANAVIR